MHKRLLTLTLTLLLAPVLSAQTAGSPVPDTAATAPQVSTTVPSPPLRLSSGDLIEVVVFDTPELSGRFRVSQDGVVRLPVGGDVSVAGLTPDAAATAIEQRFKTAGILIDPHVQVTVGEFATTGVTVLGEVKNPGNFPLLGTHTLPDVIASAGGLTTLSGDVITVVRAHDPGHPIVVRDIHAESFATNTLQLEPGDRVLVGKAGVVYVLGDVGRPGGFVVDPGAGLSILQSLSLAQGFTRTAQQRKAVIIRRGGAPIEHIGSDIQAILDGKLPDPQLRSGDVLYIPSSLVKTFTYRGIEAAIQLGIGFAIYRP